MKDSCMFALTPSLLNCKSITVVYAPTKDAEEESKEEFYDSLQATGGKIPKHNMIIIMGDLNARVGTENCNHESTHGKYGMEAMNDNDEKLCDFRETKRLTVGGALFQYKEIPKHMWMKNRKPNRLYHYQ